MILFPILICTVLIGAVVAVIIGLFTFPKDDRWIFICLASVCVAILVAAFQIGECLHRLEKLEQRVERIENK